MGASPSSSSAPPRSSASSIAALVSAGRFSLRFLRLLILLWRRGVVGYEEVFLPVACATAFKYAELTGLGRGVIQFISREPQITQRRVHDGPLEEALPSNNTTLYM